jgi:hypothetical protein
VIASVIRMIEWRGGIPATMARTGVTAACCGQLEC